MVHRKEFRSVCYTDKKKIISVVISRSTQQNMVNEMFDLTIRRCQHIHVSTGSRYLSSLTPAALFIQTANRLLMTY